MSPEGLGQCCKVLCHHLTFTQGHILSTQIYCICSQSSRLSRLHLDSVLTLLPKTPNKSIVDINTNNSYLFRGASPPQSFKSVFEKRRADSKFLHASSFLGRPPALRVFVRRLDKRDASLPIFSTPEKDVSHCSIVEETVPNKRVIG